MRLLRFLPIRVKSYSLHGIPEIMSSLFKKLSNFLGLPALANAQSSEHASLESALWVSSNTGIVFLSCDWRDLKKMPPLSLRSGARIREIVRVPPQIAGINYGYYMDGNTVVFVLYPRLYSGHYVAPDAEVFVAGNFNGWKDAIGNPAWRLRRVVSGQYDIWELRVPQENVFYGDHTEKVSFKFVTKAGEWLGPPSESVNLVLDESGNGNLCARRNQTGYQVFQFICERPIDFNLPEELVWNSADRPHAIPVKAGFMIAKIFSPIPLGSHISRDGKKTVFRIFAPRALSVSVEFWSGNVARRRFDLRPLENGVWEYEYNANLSGCFYFYYISGKNVDNTSAFAEDMPILDPYAKACCSRSGPAIVVDESQIGFPSKKFHTPDLSDLVIMEVHLRDLIARLPQFSQNKTIGFRELAEWVRSPDCYLKNLGINAVELQPIQEFDAEKREDYHWGYMTNNWFAPASHYASDPSAGTQIEEFRDLVAAFHEAGIAVILDVVYNHVGEPNHLFRVDKNYYFHLDPYGNFTNWSGCGNDYNANNPMSRKLICDSLIWMLERYGVDGFRFDLAELIGVPALRVIESTVRTRFPDAILIAEPWSFRGHIAYNLRKTAFSSWNDGFRDYAAKYVHNAVNLDGFRYFLAGSPEYFATFPAQTINYTESHDDRCWLDRITECGNSNAENPTEQDRRRTHIMFAFLLSALGTPMLAQGQDFLRTKHGKNNTYLDGDENALDYTRLIRFAKTHAFVRAWIRFRLSPRGRLFRQRRNVSREFFRFYPDQRNTAVVAIYNADFSQGKMQYALMLNPQSAEATVQIQKSVLEGFRQIANSSEIDFEGVAPESGFSHEGAFLTLPPLSVSLWIRGED